jgi:hypothetical protein
MEQRMHKKATQRQEQADEIFRTRNNEIYEEPAELVQAYKKVDVPAGIAQTISDLEKTIKEMSEKYGFAIGWHTWSHPNLTHISRHDMVKEITPPFPMDYFAYPYGEFNQVVLDVVKECGFKKAWSVTQGSMDVNAQDYNYKIFRNYI